ncbi:glycosyl hydrolase family 95 catalytic domain-containing protein [Desertivirga arenae]|uniref:glycosyl hydrolase family 95 catalytic domain-containing protein n=1 Tax=Desertivirga arenae TaxID=2810309 RepID=UPI001A95A633|nr:trehalose hydrolase [Pedobacter sp. SYSU D00823]
MYPKIKLILLLLILLMCKRLPAQPIYAGRYKAVFTSPPKKVPTSKTPDAPLAGNGDIGLTLGGTPDRLRFYLGKNDFWRAYPVYPGGGIAFPGGLDINIVELKGAAYHVEQIIDKAYISGEFTKGDLVVSLNSWVSATSNTVVAEISSNKTCHLSFKLWPAIGNTSVSKSGTVTNVYWATRSFENTPLLEWPSHVAIAMKVLGIQASKSQTLTISPGRKLIFALSMLSNQDSRDWKEEAIRDVQAFTPASIQATKVKHQKWWADFWNKSEIQIPDTFLEKYYYASQYLFACSSRPRKFAPGIWGPFITQDSTAWGGDYHLNYNYQAPYWASYSSNHIELTENFDQPLLDYMEKGRLHAKELLNQKGIYYPVGIGPKGLVTTRWPLTPEEMLKRYATTENTIDGGYKFLGQKINAVFSVGNMMMRFYSTYDKDYANTVYPYLQECANFWEEYLKFENDRYVIYMDHFNEEMPNLRNKGQWKDRLGDFNSSLSLGLVKMLFKGILDVSDYLKVDLNRREKWQHIVDHLSKFPVGTADGRLSLKSVERNASSDNPTAVGLSRVSMHGLILPGGVVGPKTEPELNKILLSDISHWKDQVSAPGDWGHTLGNGIETCYPGAVRVGYGPDVILKNLKERIAAQSLPNLWITQGGGGIETLAAVPLTINEMLMQSYEGVLRIFPNWNRSKDASFQTLRAYGAFLVSSALEKGKVRDVRILSEKGRPCVIENPWKGKTVHLKRNGQTAEQLKGELLNIKTGENEMLELQELQVEN